MIKASELRIGNIVASISGSLVTIEAMTPYGINLCYDDFGSKTETDHRFEDINPIRITPEILEKCGFRWDGHDYIPANYSHNGIDQQLCYGGPDLYFYGNSGPIGHALTTLHQLQNVFYALTGEELTYTP